MAQVLVAKRYAKALVDLAIEKDQLDAVKQDMDFVANALNENLELSEAINSPVVSAEKKVAIIKAVFADNVNSSTIEFFNLLVSHKRENTFVEAAAEFNKLYDAHKGNVVADVISATPLSNENREAVISKLKVGVKGELILNEKVDPSIIGGLIIRIGDKQIDASIANKLNELKKSFSSNL